VRSLALTCGKDLAPFRDTFKKAIQEDSMMRSLLACAAVCVAAVAVSAANPSVESALGVFNMVGNDPGKLNTYCEMGDIEEAMGDREDPAAEAKIDAYINQLGPDFEAAWDTYEGTDEDSADGKRLSAALDALDDKCPE
jgi:hypothetical protein